MSYSNDFVFEFIISFFISSISTSPFSFTGANLIIAPFFVLKNAKEHNWNDV